TTPVMILGLLGGLVAMIVGVYAWSLGVSLITLGIGVFGMIILAVILLKGPDFLSEVNWKSVKLRLIRKKFWIGLFTKPISRYPEAIKLNDIMKFVISFMVITTTYTLGHLLATGFVNISYSLLIGLSISFLYFLLSTVGNWLTDKIPHLEKGLKAEIKQLFSKEHLHPGKHARAIFTIAIGSPILLSGTFIVFYVLEPLAGTYLWILLATVLLANFGGIYESYMRSKQYPEPRIRRAEYVKNYVLTLIAILLTLSITLNPVLFLVIKRVFSEIVGRGIDLMGAGKIYEIGKDLRMALPGKNIPIYRRKGVSYLNLERKDGFYAGEKGWKQNREKERKGLTEEKINDLIEHLNQIINKILPQRLDTKNQVKKFAEEILGKASSFSLNEKGIKQLADDDNYFNAMQGVHKIVGANYEEWGRDYQLRERLAIACLLIEPPEEKWEKSLKSEYFKSKKIEVVVIEKAIARAAGFSKERIKEGVFSDGDTGCIIIINRKWDNKLELLLRIEKERAKLEIFSKTCQGIMEDLKRSEATEEFSSRIIEYHNQWYKYKVDTWHRQIRIILEGRRQELMFEYVNKFFNRQKNNLEDAEFKSLTDKLKEFKKVYLFPEKLPENLFNKEKIESFVSYNFVLEFIKFAEIKDIQNEKVLTGAQAKKFLDEVLYYYSSKKDIELGKNIWRAITEYTKIRRKKDEKHWRERIIDFFDERILPMQIILPATTMFLVSVYAFNYISVQVGVMLSVLVGLIVFTFIIIPIFSDKYKSLAHWRAAKVDKDSKYYGYLDKTIDSEEFSAETEEGERDIVGEINKKMDDLSPNEKTEIPIEMSGKETTLVLTNEDVELLKENKMDISTSEGKFLSLLSKALSFEKDKGIDFTVLADRKITYALLNKSRHLSEDCQKNSFIGINKSILEIENKEIRNIVAIVAFMHELRHEATEKNDKVFEEEQLERDVKLTLSLLKEGNISIDEYVNSLESILKESSPYLMKLKKEKSTLFNLLPSWLMFIILLGITVVAPREVGEIKEPEDKTVEKAITVQDIIDGKVPASKANFDALSRMFIETGRIGIDDKTKWAGVQKIEQFKYLRFTGIKQAVKMSMEQIVKNKDGWELLCNCESYNYLKILDYDEISEMSYLKAHWEAIKRNAEYTRKINEAIKCLDSYKDGEINHGEIARGMLEKDEVKIVKDRKIISESIEHKERMLVREEGICLSEQSIKNLNTFSLAALLIYAITKKEQRSDSEAKEEEENFLKHKEETQEKFQRQNRYILPKEPKFINELIKEGV
ncbi:hypothetical protein KAU39_06180, partial [bacterium]|nr:hypothetical protein [bacterium]